MHFLYVDESGDAGSKAGSSCHFILCGLLLHHTDWRDAKTATHAMRKRLQEQFGFPLPAELHASEFLGRNDRHLNLPRNLRFKCALHALGFLLHNPKFRPLRAIIDKSGLRTETRQLAWQSLLQQARRSSAVRPPEGCQAEGLIVVCDDHRAAPRRDLLNSLGAEIIEGIIEQPFGMNSCDTQFLQLADLLAYLTKQELNPGKAFSDGHSRRILKRLRRLFSDQEA